MDENYRVMLVQKDRYLVWSADEELSVNIIPVNPSRMQPQAQGINANHVLAGEPSG